MKKIPLKILILLFLSVTVYTQVQPEPPAERTKKNEVKKKRPPRGKPLTRAELQREVEDLSQELEVLNQRLGEIEERVDLLDRLKLSGFFDVYISNYQNKPNILEVGKFELHIDNAYKSFQVSAALVFNKGAELGVAFIDYHIFGGLISTRGRLFKEKGIHLQVGKFDVPFGNDWQRYISPHRITFSPPLTTSFKQRC